MSKFKVGDRVKISSTPQSCKFIIIEHIKGSLYEVKDINNDSIITAWEFQIKLDTEYYRDLKLRDILK